MQLPGPVRAVVGLIAVAADEARHLPDRAIELPMLAVSSALQMSLRAQQRYARLAARGDDVLNRRTPTDEPPPWAKFDEPLADDDVRAASQLLDELLGVGRPELDGHQQPAAKKTSAAKKAPAKSARKAPAKKAGATRKAAAAKTSAKTINPPRHTSPSRFDTVDDQ
jgi:hypothetical protein